jgi:MFS family permease
MPGLVCASCGYQWNLPENTRCGRCLQTLAFRPATTTAGVARPHRTWFERPRNPRELLCFLPVLMGVTSGGVVGGAIGFAASVVLVRIAHVQTDRFSRGLLMGLVLMGAIAAYVLAALLATALLRALHLAF